VLVPANAEIVLECELMATEGLTHDEGPYGEFTGMYGGGIKANFRKGGIYQHATIGGKHPWYTDNMLQLPMIESDLYGGLAMAGIDVKEVRAPLGGLSNIAYAKINTRGAGDSKQALGVMLTRSKQGLPKIAMDFDEDVDIWDDNAVQCAMAFRYMPHLDAVTIPNCNTMTVDPTIVDPMIAEDAAPGTTSKIGLDCTIPISPKFNPSHFDRSMAFELGDPPSDLVVMSEAELTPSMAALIREAPRTWKEILQHYNGPAVPRRLRSVQQIFVINSDAATTNRRTPTRSPTPILPSMHRNGQSRTSTRGIARNRSRLSELAGLVIACGLLDDDVQTVDGAHEGDEAHQRGELVLVVVLDGIRPHLVGHAACGVGDAGALLRQLKGSALRFGEHRGLSPGRDQVEARRGLPGVRGVLGVHVGAETAAIDLAGAQRYQLPRRGRQRRARDRPARRGDVLQDLACGRVVEEVQASVHGALLVVGGCTSWTPRLGRL
jgi:hypothetical protein